MPNKKEILNELKEISPLLCTIENDNPLTVPSQYFEQLSSNILSAIKKDALATEEITAFDFGSIPAISRDLPDNYFESLSGRILSTIKRDELIEELNAYPLLLSLKGKNVFTIPQDYFENIAIEISEKIANENSGKVVSINRGKVISMKSTWWKAAAAAVIAGVVAVSSYFVLDNNPTSTVQTSYISSTNEYKTPEQVNLAIASLSDDEIADYLEDHGNILDNDLLIKDVSTKGLPSPEDYLLDDNALNNYLNEIGASNAQKIN